MSFLSFNLAFAQAPFQFAVIPNTTIDTIRKEITIDWNIDSTMLRMYVTTNSSNPNSFRDTLYKNVIDAKGPFTFKYEEGKEYELKLHKKCLIYDTTKYDGFNYLLLGCNIAPKHFIGKILIIVENTIIDSLSNELYQFKQDLIGEGWEVEIAESPRVELFNAKAVEFVKNIIIEKNKKSNNSLKTVLLVGRVPMPYSGDFSVDGHSNHYGSWPSDSYYSDLTKDGWQDDTTKDNSSEYKRMNNNPRDGKFDNSRLPNKANLEIGRIDFSNLPTFKESELSLFRNYFMKNHQYRTDMYGGAIRTNKTILNDNFGTFGGEAFASLGWSNFSQFVGLENIETKRIKDITQENSYLWAFGCSPGSGNSIWDIAYSDMYASLPLKVPFMILFGSYNGDMDFEDNLHRSAIASKPYCLASLWACRPFWVLHRMVMGHRLGEAVLLTLNNDTTFVRQNDDFNKFVHISLTGDPTLKMYITQLPDSAKLIYDNLANTITANIPKLNENEIGYYIYQSDDGEKYELYSNEIFSYDKSFDKKHKYNMIRLAKKIYCQNGSFIDLSKGRIFKF